MQGRRSHGAPSCKALRSVVKSLEAKGNRKMSLPSLTVVLVTQNAQNRIPRVLDALAKQTVAAELEVFIVYIAPAHPAPVSPDGLRVIPVDQSNIINMGQARAAGDACRSGWARRFC